MVTDKMLRDATAEAERFLLTELPEEKDTQHEFSQSFEKKMKNLIHRSKHPIRYQAIRAAAAIVLVIATLFGALMAFNPGVRAMIVGWIRGIFSEYVSYSIHESKGPEDTVYYLSSIPDGYQEWQILENLTGMAYMYTNNSGQILHFAYHYGVGSSALFLAVDGYEQYSAFVNGIPADIYIAVNKNETSAIIWQEPNTGVLFQISAAADKEELINLAESVEGKEK